MPGSGFSEKLETKHITPRYHGTDMTQQAFASIIARIESLPAFKGFRFIKDGEDAPEFLGAITGKGSCNAGRKGEQIVLTLELVNPPDSTNIVGEIFWKQLDTLYFDINNMPELKSCRWKLANFYNLKGYDLDDKKPPKKVILVFEYYPVEQQELDERIANDNFIEFANKLRAYLLPDNTETSWQVLIELIKKTRKEQGRG